MFFVLAASSSTDGIRAVEAEVAPLLAAHADAILLDPALFARIEAVAQGVGVAPADPVAAGGAPDPATNPADSAPMTATSRDAGGGAAGR